MKKLLFILLLVIIAINPGCGEKKQANNGKTEVIFWHAMGGPLGKVLTNMINQFNKENPDIYIHEVVMGNYGPLEQKILASVSSGSSPDIAQMFEAVTLKMANAGKLYQLDDMLTQEDKDDIIPALLANNTYDGKMWSMPFNKSFAVMYYNKDHFKEVGLDPERPPKTWKEYREYLLKLTRDTNNDGKTDIYGTGLPIESSWLFESMIVQQGQKLISDDKKKTYFDSPECEKVLKYWLDLVNKDKVAYTTTGYNHQNDFIGKKNSMIIGTIVSKVFMQDKITFPYNIAPIPSWDENKKSSVISGTNVIMFNNGNEAKKKAAWKFIKWFTDTKQTVNWALNTTYMPVRKSALKDPEMVNAIKKDPRLNAAICQLDYAQFEPRIAAWYTCRQKLGSMLDAAFNTKAPLKEIIKKKNDEIINILKED